MAFISKGPNLRTKWNLFTMYAKIYIDRWVKAGEINQDKEKAKTFKKFGILGIVWALVAAASVFPCVWVATMLFKLAMTNLGFFTYFILIGNIVLFVFGISMLFVPFVFASTSIAYPIAQMRVNRSFISWFSLIFCILVTVGLLGLGLFAAKLL